MARTGLALGVAGLLAASLLAACKPATEAGELTAQAVAAAPASQQSLEPSPARAEPAARAQPAPAASPADAPAPDAPASSAAAAAGPVPGGSAVDAARAFYDLHMQVHASGVPDGEDLVRYRPFLSKRLLARMERALRERDRMIAEEPELKPPNGEGDLFSGLTEGAGAYQLGAHRALAPDRERVDLSFVYDDTRDVVRWRGRALMVREDGRWKLDDVEYGDFDAGVQGPFVRSSSLWESIE